MTRPRRVRLAAVVVVLAACRAAVDIPPDDAPLAVEPPRDAAAPPADVEDASVEANVDGDADAEAAALPDVIEAEAAASVLVEKTLTLEMSLGGSTLVVTARDGTTPLYTDLWLYSLGADGGRAPITDFSSDAPRPNPRLMMPATIRGQDSGLVPADDGVPNGVMTSSRRGVLSQGAFVSTMSGTVTITFPAVPTSPILVVAAVEDQRYAGAGVILPDGTAGTVPDGIGAPETHRLVSFANEAQPILFGACARCHTGENQFAATDYLVNGSSDDLVNDNYGLTEETVKCQVGNPGGGAPLDRCIRAITLARFLVEPGAPAASDLLIRARPDEDGSTSPEGLSWYGNDAGSRFENAYGDRRMPSTVQTTSSNDWDPKKSTPFDDDPRLFQVLFDWVAQGALP
jgi:hypothetical protein